MPLNLREHNRLDELEDAIVDFLPTVCTVDTFGCEVNLVHPDSQEPVKHPMWELFRTTRISIYWFTTAWKSLSTDGNSKIIHTACNVRKPSNSRQMPQVSSRTGLSVQPCGQDMSQ